MHMSHEEFLKLQSSHQSSGLTLKSYLQQIGTSYSTYNYWRKKYGTAGDSARDLAPISIRHEGFASSPSISGDVPSGVSLLFPNGLRAHFGSGTEEVLLELFNKSLSSHVLP